MWLAVAAMAVASLARVQAGVENATVYTNPVLEFLAGQQNAAKHAASGSTAIRALRLGAQTGSAHVCRTPAPAPGRRFCPYCSLAWLLL